MTIRLPDASSLGPSPVPQPSTQVWGYDATITSRAELAAAEQTMQLGKELGQQADELQVAQDKSTYAAARSEFLQAKIGLDTRFAADEDFATAPQRYEAALSTLATGIEKGLSQRVGQVFRMKSVEDLSSGVGKLETIGRERQRSADQGSVLDTLKANRDAYLASDDPADGTALFGSSGGLLNAARDKGLFTPTQVEALREGWARDVIETKLNALPPQERLDRLGKMIGTGENGEPVFTKTNTTLDFLDPQRVVALKRQAEREVEAQRREWLSDMRGRVADAEYALDRGHTPPDLVQLQGALRGTELEGRLNDAVGDLNHIRDFRSRPLDEQASRLNGMAATDVADRRQVELQGRMARVYNATIEQIRAGNGLQVAAELGHVSPIAPLPAPTSDQMPEALRRRAAQADTASQKFGVPVSPLSPGEVKQIESTIDSAPADAATATIAGLHRGLGDKTAQVLAGTWAKDRPELGIALATVGDRPDLAREIVQGGKLVRQNKDVVPTKENRISALRSVVGDMLTPDTASLVDPYMEAATAVYAQRRVGTGDLSYDGSAFSKALKDVLGGPVSFNGRTILPPMPDMEASKVRDLVRGLTYDKMTEFGNGAPVYADGKPFDPKLFERSTFGDMAQLVTVAPGRYLVTVGSRYVATAQGRAYLLDLRSAAR